MRWLSDFENKEPVFVDTETCGLYSMPVLIQYAVGNGEIRLWHIWYETIEDTIKLIETITNHMGGVVMFNSSFDWFHIYKLWCCLSLIKDKSSKPKIFEVANIEKQARDYLCLKPRHTLDLMLYARKGPYQSTMDHRISAELRHE